MAQIVFDKGGKRHFVHTYFDAQHFTSGEEPYSKSRNTRWAEGVEQQLHEAGITSARAVADATLAPIGAGLVEASQVSEEINWGDLPWRITPVKTGDGRYMHTFHDDETNTTQSIIGATPQEVVDRLLIPSPIYQKHIASLPAFNPAPVQVPAALVETGPVRILRHGDRTDGLPERRIETPKSQVSSREFEHYVDSLSNEEYKIKMRDPEFARAVDALPAKKWQ